MYKPRMRLALSASLALLAACQQQPAPPPPPAEPLTLPAVVRVPDHDETRAEVQQALAAMDRQAQFRLAAAVAAATDWKKHAKAWKNSPAAPRHKVSDVPLNSYPDYWFIRREVAAAIRAELEQDPAFTSFLATRQTEDWYWQTRAADALACVSLRELMEDYAREHPEDEGAHHHNDFLRHYVQDKNGDQAFPFYLW